MCPSVTWSSSYCILIPDGDLRYDCCLGKAQYSRTGPLKVSLQHSSVTNSHPSNRTTGHIGLLIRKRRSKQTVMWPDGNAYYSMSRDCLSVLVNLLETILVNMNLIVSYYAKMNYFLRKWELGLWGSSPTSRKDQLLGHRMDQRSVAV